MCSPLIAGSLYTGIVVRNGGASSEPRQHVHVQSLHFDCVLQKWGRHILIPTLVTPSTWISAVSIPSTQCAQYSVLTPNTDTVHALRSDNTCIPVSDVMSSCMGTKGLRRGVQKRTCWEKKRPLPTTTWWKWVERREDTMQTTDGSRRSRGRGDVDVFRFY